MNGMSSFFRIRSRVRKLPVLSHLTKGAFSLSRRWLNRFITTGVSNSLFVEFHSAPVWAFFWLADKDAGIWDAHSFAIFAFLYVLCLGALRVRLKLRIYLRINFLISKSKKNTNSEKLTTKELLFQEFDSFEWWMKTYSRPVRLRVSYSSP